MKDYKYSSLNKGKETINIAKNLKSSYTIQKIPNFTQLNLPEVKPLRII